MSIHRNIHLLQIEKNTVKFEKKELLIIANTTLFSTDFTIYTSILI